MPQSDENKTEMNSCRENIKKIRTACGFTQQQVADALGIERSAYTCYETGRSTPSVSTLFKLARIFGVPVDRLTSTSEHPFEPKKDPITFSSFMSEGEKKPWNSLEYISRLSAEEKELLLCFRSLSDTDRKEVKKRAQKLKEKELNMDE